MTHIFPDYLQILPGTIGAKKLPKSCLKIALSHTFDAHLILISIQSKAHLQHRISTRAAQLYKNFIPPLFSRFHRSKIRSLVHDLTGTHIVRNF